MWKMENLQTRSTEDGRSAGYKDTSWRKSAKIVGRNVRRSLLLPMLCIFSRYKIQKRYKMQTNFALQQSLAHSLLPCERCSLALHPVVGVQEAGTETKNGRNSGCQESHTLYPGEGTSDKRKELCCTTGLETLFTALPFVKSQKNGGCKGRHLQGKTENMTCDVYFHAFPPSSGNMQSADSIGLN